MRKKYRLAKWSVVCSPKDQAGPGVQDLEVKNTSLLGKWIFKLLTNDGTWQTILKRKYIGSRALSQVLWKPGDSHFWAGLMATKKYLFTLGSFAIKDGSEIRFLEDKWLGNTTLHEQYPALYYIVRHKAIPSPRFWRLLHRRCRSGEIYLARNLSLGMPCFNVWQMSNCNLAMMNFSGIFMKMANFQ
jgi:hypothetical protein